MQRRLVALVLAWSAAVPAAAPAHAASVLTAAFVAEAAPTADHLAAASGLATTVSPDRRLRAFARREEAAQARLGADLAAWVASARRADAAAADTPSIDGLGRVFAQVDAAADIVVTPLQPHSPQVPDATPRLRTLDGRAFDDLYVASQIAGLARLVALCDDYVRNGDDTGLRALAVHELPRARALLADARRL